MPHFYRYRGDEPDVDSKARTPARASSIINSRTSTDMAHIRCLGMGADICIPADDDKNKVSLNVLFYELDKTIQSLKDENQQLRAEVEYLKVASKRTSSGPTVVQAAPVQPSPPPAAADPDLEDRLTSKIKEVSVGVDDCRAALRENKSLAETDLEAVKTLVKNLESRQNNYEKEIQETIQNIPTTTVVEKETAPTTQQVQSKPVEVESEVPELISVIFDAVRTEDWIGQDGFIPFSKLNVDVGGGMDINSGKFTAPKSGIYFFNVNVYGAPRDQVVLSIRANEFQEVASCSGVGKASQSCIVDLDEKDTVGVYVNEKSKLTDNGNNRFTHFIGFLMRPK